MAQLLRSGPAWILVAALLWATDALLRVRSLEALDPTLIVLIEHLWIMIALAASLLHHPWRREVPLRSKRLMGLAALVGAGGSALATVLFTASFQRLNPTVVVLVQKLQPVMVVLLARVLLSEMPKPTFYLWGAIALVSAIALTLPDAEHLSSASWSGMSLSFGAAALWALSTVAGRKLLLLRPVFAVTFWRFAWGSVALAVGILLTQGPSALTQGFRALSQDRSLLGATLYLSLGPGLLAMAAYYRGLSQVSAGHTTLLELVFPVCAVILNWVFLGATLTPTQWIAGAVLLGAVSRIKHK